MIIDKSSTEPIDLKTRLYTLVAENKMSSLDRISGMVGTDEEEVRAMLKELVSDGDLKGFFTEDGQRFFLSEVSVSSAPVADTKDKGYEVARGDTRNGRIVLISGLVTLIVGYILRGLTLFGGSMEPIGSAVFMMGLGVLLAGWLMISRAQPPSNIK
ncbi:MAG: hypothetical protein ACFFBJ_07845 [Promethearchaeota archaeon]